MELEFKNLEILDSTWVQNSSVDLELLSADRLGQSIDWPFN